MQELLELGRKLSLNSEKVEQDLKLVLDAPSEYVKKYMKRLEERGINKEVKNLPWIALVNSLIDEGFAFEIDWKAENETVKYAVEILLKRKHFSNIDCGWISEFDEIETEQVLKKINFELKKELISLAYLDIDSDSYVLVIVPVNELSDLKALANNIGYKLVDLL